MDIFKIVGTIALNGQKEFSSGVAGAIDKGKKLASAVGHGLATAAKVGGVALTAATGAVAALSKTSLDAYSNFEQLAGGIGKIFDEMDNSKIFADAQNAWKDLNMSANEYLTTIVDVGANLATSMGDEKGYEMTRRGMQAMSDYATGTGKDIDVLNEKFTLITRSTSSYQSIADQFSGMLPATSKDFLSQAQAAGFLSKKYKELTQVPLAEYQEAVVLMMEEGTDALGLTGNTANETATTISGSLAALKATWQNLLVGFADPEQDLGALTSNLVESVAAVGDNIIPKISEMLPRIGSGIVELAQGILPYFSEMVSTLLPELISGAESLVDSAIELLPDLISTAIENLPDLIEAGVSIISKLSIALVQAIPLLVEALPELLSALWDGFVELGETFMEMGRMIWEMILDGLDSAFGEGTSDGILQYFQNVWIKIQEIWNQLSPYFESIWEDAVGFVQTAWDIIQSIWEFAGPYFAMVWEQIKNTFSTVAAVIGGFFALGWSTVSAAWSIATSYFQQIWDTIKGIFSAVKSVLSGDFQGAWDAIQGIVVGWAEYFQSVWDDIKGVFEDAVDVGSKIVDDIKEGIKNAWSGLTSWFKELWNGLFGNLSADVTVNKKSTDEDGSHANGLFRVPFDGYIAELHKDEMVLTRAQAEEYRRKRTEPARNTSGITIIQNIQTVPQTPVEIAATTQAYFEQARWAF